MTIAVKPCTHHDLAFIMQYFDRTSTRPFGRDSAGTPQILFIANWYGSLEYWLSG